MPGALRPRSALWLLALLIAGCGAAAGGKPPQHRTSAVTRAPATGRAVVIVMENKEFADVIGNRAAPYTNGLAKRFALLKSSYAVAHPSLPNYLALTGGSTFGITSDCTSCHVGAQNLVDQLQRAQVSWRAYMEDMPSPCYRGSFHRGYAKKHDPFVYYDDVTRDPRRCRRVVPLTELNADLRRGTLPRFAWISPNLCHDTHDCGVSSGDRYLGRLVPRLLPELGPDGALYLTWDEGSSDHGCCRQAAGGHIATIVAGRAVRRALSYSGPADHYSVLRSVEDRLGLGRLGFARCPCTPSLDALFARRG